MLCWGVRGPDNGLCQANVDYAQDVFGNSVDGSLFAECNDAAGVSGGDGFVGCVDAPVEVVALRLKSVFVSTGARDAALIATPRTQERGFKRGQQQDGEIRLDVVTNGGVHGEDPVGAEAASCALVSLGRVGKAIAQHNSAGRKSGFYHLLERLSPVCKHQRHFGERADRSKRRFGTRVKQNRADAVAERRGARVAEGNHTMALHL